VTKSKKPGPKGSGGTSLADRGDPALRPLRPKNAKDERRRLPIGCESWTLDQWTEHHLLVRASVEFNAAARLAQLLDTAVNDPEVLASPEHSRYAALMRELLSESMPQDRLEDLLRPLEVLLGSWRANSGARKPGRPKAMETYGEWHRQYEGLRKSRPSLNATERYEDVASDWNSSHGTEFKWQHIKNKISAYKRANERLE
jgi:hypothetical protein